MPTNKMRAVRIKTFTLMTYNFLLAKLLSQFRVPREEVAEGEGLLPPRWENF
jgi:hypothetical protein